MGRRSRSVAAIVIGFFTVVVLSLVTDQVLHVLEVYPPWGEAMREPSLNLLALSYRTVFNVVGGYLTARVAPTSPLRHALVLGVVGTVMGTLGAIATIPMNLGPAWYPIALVITAVPGCWLGGWLFERRREALAS